jgi:hypothetical protein
VQQVADLLAGPAETLVLERLSKDVGRRPEGEHPLLHLAELAGTGDHAAAIDHRPQSIGIGVLLNDQFRGQLARSVERARQVGGKLLRDAADAGAGPGLLVFHLKARRLLPQAKLLQGSHRVDPRRREKHERARPPARQLQAAQRASEVGLQHVMGGASQARQTR